MKKGGLKIGLRNSLLLCIAVGILPCLVRGQTITDVWPGDVNTNGQVNHIDLLYMGLHFGDTGPGRDSVSINWTLHSVTKWLPAVAGRPDPSSADCNGDSTINAQDILAIETNYSLDNGFIVADSSSLINSSVNSPALSLSYGNGPLVGGGTDTIFIELGDANNPVDSLLGFAATLSFDSSLVDSAYVIFDNSWLGTPGTDLVQVDAYRPGQLDLAGTRTDQTDALQGQGRVGGVVIVMIDNLKTLVEVDSLKLEFTTALAMKSTIRVVPLRTELQVAPVYSGTEAIEALIYPNPAREAINVSMLAPTVGPYQVRLMNSTGGLVRQLEFTNSQFTLRREGLLNGFYLLEISTQDAILRRKIIFLN